MKKKYALLLFALISMTAIACSQTSAGNGKLLGGCEGCEMMFDGMPENIGSTANIAGPKEPGQRMVISGTIFKVDGKTPAPGVILYVYQTDNTGEYTPAPDQKYAKRHGHLRGWAKSDANGRYELNTIRPASYPNSKNPQHIHPIISEPGKGYYWIDEYLFEDDPLLTEKDRSQSRNRGGNGIITLTKNDKGIWIGKRDIVLGKNIPGY